MSPGWTRRGVALIVAALALTACGSAGSPEQALPQGSEPMATPAPPASDPAPALDGAAGSASASDPVGTTPAPEARASAVDPPPWLGTRPLPLGPGGYGVIRPTPPELADRRLRSTDHLAPPPGGTFTSSAGVVPPAVVERSTWDPACPVGLDDLRYLTVSFWGFDDRPHTGELLVHAEVVDEVLGVFARLYDTQFPIEEMRITRPGELAELAAHPTGDGNNTEAFVCRPSRGTTSWSEHAYGRAVDINPFHNPYLKGDVVLPELASAYADRAAERPGMILSGDVATSAFAEVGWGWGGTWRSAKDYMHFSVNGR